MKFNPENIVQLRCAHCGKTYYKTQHRLNELHKNGCESNYCSDLCKFEARKTHEMRTCANCGRQFYNSNNVSESKRRMREIALEAAGNIEDVDYILNINILEGDMLKGKDKIFIKDWETGETITIAEMEKK